MSDTPTPEPAPAPKVVDLRSRKEVVGDACTLNPELLDIPVTLAEYLKTRDVAGVAVALIARDGAIISIHNWEPGYSAGLTGATSNLLHDLNVAMSKGTDSDG